MSPTRLVFLIPILFLTACASAPDQLASRECKVVVADFAGKPSKDVNRAEQAAAEMRVARLAYSRGGYTSGNNLVADVVRDCY
ncbi:MAG: hypothetical protein ABI831_12145 [Betaproteobacteria bacterium]